MSTAPFLAIRKVAKSFGGVPAVSDVSLDIGRGEFLTCLGPSGSGKSTTLYIVAGFMTPNTGEVELDGRSLLEVPPHRRNIGMVFQRYTLFPHLSVRENIAFPLRVRRRPAAAIAAKVDAMLALARLEPYADRLPGHLSGGQQQRVALARALAYDPPLLLMDEPLSALDKKLRDEIQIEIRRIHRETGVTILYVTHDQEEALRLSDRIALFKDGRIEQIGTGADLYLRPASRFVGGFIGNSNFLRAERLDGRTLRLPNGLQLAHAGAGAPGPVQLMVRPEAIRLAETDATAALGVTVKDVTFLGESLHLSTETDWSDELTLRLPLASLTAAPTIGQRIAVTWPVQACPVFAA